MATLRDADWRVLLKAIREGNCVLLLGPGAAIDPDNPSGESLPVQLAHKLAAELRERYGDIRLVAPDNLAHVAQTFVRQESSRSDLEDTAEEFYKSYIGKTTSLHRDLAALPFTLCIGTNPEPFLLNAFRERGKRPLHDFYNFREGKEGHSVQPADEKSPTEPLVYDLFGALPKTNSLVLSENDLLDFLVAVIAKTPPLNGYVCDRVSRKETSFLFVGFGFRQWHVRVLLHVLAKDKGQQRTKSLAIEDAAFFADPTQQEAILHFKNDHLITFYQEPWQDFVRKLRRRYEIDTPPPPPPLPPADAPTVFLCHENRDKEQAELLDKQLRRLGINTWLDKQNLMGGDNWENLISDVLKRQTDYVVVLQSPNMLDKAESYFKAEIKYALERQDKFGEFRFVIPVILRPDSRLPLGSLTKLQLIDYSRGDKVDDIVKTIRDDWKKRPPDMKRGRA